MLAHDRSLGRAEHHSIDPDLSKCCNAVRIRGNLAERRHSYPQIPPCVCWRVFKWDELRFMQQMLLTGGLCWNLSTRFIGTWLIFKLCPEQRRRLRRWRGCGAGWRKGVIPAQIIPHVLPRKHARSAVRIPGPASEKSFHKCNTMQ